MLLQSRQRRDSPVNALSVLIHFLSVTALLGCFQSAKSILEKTPLAKTSIALEFTQIRFRMRTHAQCLKMSLYLSDTFGFIRPYETANLTV